MPNCPRFRVARLRPLRAQRRLLSAAITLGVMMGCAPVSQDRPLIFSFAKGWHSPAVGAPRLIDNDQWWQGLNDPTLDALIAQALHSNPDLTAARARVTSALATAQSVPGAVSLSSGGDIAKTGGRTGALSVDLGLDNLFDPGQSRAATRRSVRAGADLAVAQNAGARLLLISRVAETYLALRNDQRRVALSRAEASRQRQTLELAQKLANAGEGTQIEALRSQARLASLEAARPALDAAVAKDIAQLSVLAGYAPGALPANLQARLLAIAPQPRVKLAPDPGIPADLIRNRPDIQVAAARYDAARAALGQAKAAFYPQLSLSGTIEISRSYGFSGASTDRAYSIGPSLRLPALPQGPARARASAAEAEITAAHADWTSAVLTALNEVEAALIDYRSAARTESGTDHALSLYVKTRKLMRDSAALGEATLSDLILVEDALSAAESAQADAQFARSLAFVRLNQRLGAGVRPPMVKNL